MPPVENPDMVEADGNAPPWTPVSRRPKRFARLREYLRELAVGRGETGELDYFVERQAVTMGEEHPKIRHATLGRMGTVRDGPFRSYAAAKRHASRGGPGGRIVWEKRPKPPERKMVAVDYDPDRRVVTLGGKEAAEAAALVDATRNRSQD